MTAQNSFSVDHVLNALQTNLQDRKGKDPNDSYVASLYTKGLNKILEKVGEEATEVILAAKDYENALLTEQEPRDGLKDELVSECADLFFHTSVALAHLNLPLSDIFRVIETRLGQSGHAEKQSRSH